MNVTSRICSDRMANQKWPTKVGIVWPKSKNGRKMASSNIAHCECSMHIVEVTPLSSHNMALMKFQSRVYCKSNNGPFNLVANLVHRDLMDCYCQILKYANVSLSDNLKLMRFTVFQVIALCGEGGEYGMSEAVDISKGMELSHSYLVSRAICI